MIIRIKEPLVMESLNRLRFSIWPKIGLIYRKKDIFVRYKYTQDVVTHHSIWSDTLLHRFFNYFGSCPKYSKLIVQPGSFELLREKFVIKHSLLSESEKNSFQMGESHTFTERVNKLPLKDLLEFIVFLSNGELVKDTNHYKALVRALDNVCYEKISDLTVEEAVKMNYCWINLVGNRVKSLKSFASLMDHYITNIKKSIKTPVVVLMIFCSGIARKDPKAKEIVNSGLNCICNDKEQLRHLTTSEMILLSEVAFKTSSKIINPIFIENLVTAVANDVPKFTKDPALFVVIVKTMRHNRNRNWNLLKNIQKCLVGDSHILRTYNFAGKTHLIALYADALYGDQEFLNYLIDSAICSIAGTDNYNPYNEKGKGRAKDMDRLLWSASYLGFKINENILEKIIMPVIMEKITKGVYDKQLHVLIGTILSLWIMGYKQLNLLPFVFTEDMKKYLYEINRVRYKARLQLLLTCISIENPEAMNSVELESFHVGDTYNPGEEKLLQPRPFLKRVLQDVRSLLYTSNSIKVRCENSLPSLNIPGIFLSSTNNHCRNGIHIEVLDNTNCLHETSTPNGLMILKMRLLRKLGHQVILVNSSEYEKQQTQIMTQIEEESRDIQGS